MLELYGGPKATSGAAWNRRQHLDAAALALWKRPAIRARFDAIIGIAPDAPVTPEMLRARVRTVCELTPNGHAIGFYWPRSDMGRFSDENLQAALAGLRDCMWG